MFKIFALIAASALYLPFAAAMLGNAAQMV